MERETSLLNVASWPEACQLTVDDIGERRLSADEVAHILKLKDAFWIYQGEPRPDQPHALLKSGKHSNGFIYTKEALDCVNICDIFAYQMKLAVEEIYSDKIDWVVGSAYSAIDITHSLASYLGATYHGIVEKDAQGAPTQWRSLVRQGERVLAANELMTTAAGSTFETKEAVATQNKIQPVEFVPFVVVMVHRSADYTLKDGTEVVCGVHYDIANYGQEGVGPQEGECPYCVAGSPALKPKLDDNWQTYFRS